MYDAIIIGSGFFGTAIANFLSKKPEFQKIIILEQEPEILKRASFVNQARVHNGYHYPRSLTTAYRSRVNLPKFARDWPEAVVKDFTNVYAISRRNSKVTAKQFERFCKVIGASVEVASKDIKDMFNMQLVEQVYLTEEYAFNAQILALKIRESLKHSMVDVKLNSRVINVMKGQMAKIQVTYRNSDQTFDISGRFVFNCTYSGLNQIAGDFPGTEVKLKQEIAELALVDVPAPLKKMGVTLMDGPFFSLMPFPSNHSHSLSHVRYTPHVSWADSAGLNPYLKLENFERISQVDRMLRDSARYLPMIQKSKYLRSLYEVKTILQKNEIDDGRPILLERSKELPRLFSVLGGKIDNIYDVFDYLEKELKVET